MNRYLCCGEIRDGAVVVRRFTEGVRYTCEGWAPKPRQYVWELPVFPILNHGLQSGFRRNLPRTAAEAHAAYVLKDIKTAARKLHPHPDSIRHWERVLSLPYVVEELPHESLFDLNPDL